MIAHTLRVSIGLQDGSLSKQLLKDNISNYGIEGNLSFTDASYFEADVLMPSLSDQ